jgi:murein DD-endopeptidase MepM/ murein hydrolase activator NlpD
VDVVAKKDEPVKCVADGTVILSSWTNDTGHIIAIQHQGNLISVYKHNSVLLKKAGNFVRAGEIISVIGNSGELTTGPHLHFELWHNSNPVNPEIFVSF